MPDICPIKNSEYVILGKMPGAGMSYVYRAAVGFRPVVIKTPRLKPGQEENGRARFRAEVHTTRLLAHPHIVPIIDSKPDLPQPYLVTRYLPGGTLRVRQPGLSSETHRDSSLSWLHTWLADIAEALDYVHSRGLVHRDVKPGNIFFDAHGTAFLGDFGVSSRTPRHSSTPLTRDGCAVGTIDYFAPERLLGSRKDDGQGDQYSLAVILYELLTGSRPFVGDWAHIAVEHATVAPTPLIQKRPDLPVTITAAIMKGLSKKPEERFPSCSGFAHAILENCPRPLDRPLAAKMACPSCCQLRNVPFQSAGKTCRCKGCNAVLTVAGDLSTLWSTDELQILRRENKKRTASRRRSSSELLPPPAAQQREKKGLFFRSRPAFVAILFFCLVAAIPIGFLLQFAQDDDGRGTPNGGRKFLLQPEAGDLPRPANPAPDVAVGGPALREANPANRENAKKPVDPPLGRSLIDQLSSALDPPPLPGPLTTRRETGETGLWNRFCRHFLASALAATAPQSAAGSAEEEIRSPATLASDSTAAIASGDARSQANYASQMAWRVIDSPGNSPDQSNGLGAVADAFAIGMFEVTNADFCAYLNSTAAAPENASTIEGSLPPGIRIERTTENDQVFLHYTPAPYKAEKPVVGVSWHAAAGFANWLHNGGNASAGTQQGVYDLTDGPHQNRTVPPKSPESLFWIPTIDEWYKAAYYDNGEDPRYYRYPTGSNDRPRPYGGLDARSRPVFDAPQTANFAVSCNTADDAIANLMSCGQSGCISGYGVHDMGGNAAEIVVHVDEGAVIHSCGGDVAATMTHLQRTEQPHTTEPLVTGFRLCRTVTPEVEMLQARWEKAMRVANSFETAKHRAWQFVSISLPRSQERPTLEAVMTALETAAEELESLSPDEGNAATEQMMSINAQLIQEFSGLASVEQSFRAGAASLNADISTLQQLPPFVQNIGAAFANTELQRLYQENAQQYQRHISSIRDLLAQRPQ